MDVLVFFFADLTVPAAISLAVCGWASCASVLYLTHDARPIESGRLDPLLVAVANARYDARELAAGVALDARLSLRHAAVTGAALAALLLPATEGATR